MEPELLGFAFEHARPQDVPGEEIAGALDPLKIQTQELGQAPGKSGLAHSWQVFYQEMTLGQQAGQGQVQLFLLVQYGVGCLIK